MAWAPFWHSEARIESGGRYPLGLNAFHDHLDNFINKGIIHGAYRLQYMAFYCWAIGDAHASLSKPTYSQFRGEFAKRENAFSLGLRLLHPAASIPGDTAMRAILAKEDGEYSLSFRLLESQDFGVYGLNYAGAMAGFRLTTADEKWIPQLTEDGVVVYEIVDNLLRDTALRKRYLHKGVAPESALTDFATRVDLDFLRQPAGQKLREIFIRILFHLDEKGPSHRRSTFAYYLETIANVGGQITPFDHQAFYELACFGEYQSEGRSKIKQKSNVVFSSIRSYWQIYFMHSQFRWWIDKYFVIFLEYLKGSADGATEQEFLSNLNIEEVAKLIGTNIGKEKVDPENLLRLISESLNFRNNTSLNFHDNRVATQIETENRSEVIAQMTLFLVGIWKSLNNWRQIPEYQVLVTELSGDLWPYRLMSDFPKLPEMGYLDWLGKLLKIYVIRQHDEVAYRKGDLRRVWFTKVNGRYLFQMENKCQWIDGHFYTVLHYLHELKLVTTTDEKTIVTKEGQVFLNKLLDEYLA